MTWAKLIEVKFRRSFTRSTASELFDTLKDQRVQWPQSYAVLLIGEPYYPDARFHQDYIRVIPPDRTDDLLGPRGIDIPADERDALHLLWEQLPKLSEIFRFRDFEHYGEQRDDHGWNFFSNADFATAAIRELGRL